jgi:hypothetical protein
MPRYRMLAVSLAVWGCMTASAHAAQTVKLKTAFIPDKLGTPTTIEFGFTIKATTAGAIPQPLLAVDLHLPAGVNPATSTLGDAQCTAKILVEDGLEGCPPNSRIGFGRALAAVRIGPETILEKAVVSVLNGPPVNQHIVMLFNAEGVTPVAAQVVFPAEVLLQPAGAFGGQINALIPLIPSLPGAPDVSVLHFESTLGPLHLVYYTRQHGRVVVYHPEGIAVPTSCPRGGFPFAAEFMFMDGSKVTGRSTVPCPGRHRHHHRARK